MDYRELLKKYIELIIIEESTDFLLHAGSFFSPEQYAALDEIVKELDAEEKGYTLPVISKEQEAYRREHEASCGFCGKNRK